MLFWLIGEDDLAQAVGSDVTLSAAVQNLCVANLNGLHVLAGDRPALLQLADVDSLDPASRATLRRTAQQMSQDAAKLATCVKLRVSASAVAPQAVGQDWIVPLRVFADPRVCERAKILVENLTDYRVLEHFARRLLTEDFRGMSLSLQPLNGGGNTTADVLEDELQHMAGRILCVVDSDRKVPEESAKETARRCQSALRRFAGGGWRAALHVLSAREIENVLPLETCLGACADMHPAVRDKVRELKCLPEVVQAHVCMKSGDALCRFYLAGLLECSEPEDDPSCHHCGKAKGCGATPGLGERFLRRVAVSLTNGSAGIPAPESWPAELRELAASVVMTGLARPVSRAA